MQWHLESKVPTFKLAEKALSWSGQEMPVKWKSMHISYLIPHRNISVCPDCFVDMQIKLCAIDNKALWVHKVSTSTTSCIADTWSQVAIGKANQCYAIRWKVKNIRCEQGSNLRGKIPLDCFHCHSVQVQRLNHSAIAAIGSTLGMLIKSVSYFQGGNINFLCQMEVECSIFLLTLF